MADSRSGGSGSAGAEVTGVLPGAPVVRRDVVVGTAGEEMAVTRELLALVGAAGHGPVLRLYRPRATVAFGRREVHRPGYAAACEAARQHGFEPVVRNAGGQAVAYGEGSLVVELVGPDLSPAAGLQARFAAFADVLVAGLRTLGVDARTGPIDGEYCPGEHSVHGVGPISRVGLVGPAVIADAGFAGSAGALGRVSSVSLTGGDGGRGGPAGGAVGRVKLAGTAQRLVARAWLCAASVVVTGAARPRAVLVEVNRHLGFEWCPSTFGAVTDLVPTATVTDVEDAMVAAFGVAAAGVTGASAAGASQTAAGVSEGRPTGASAARATGAAGVEAGP